jgi:hypothetical protein
LRDGIDPRFELSRYGERLAASAPSFDPLRAALERRRRPGRRSSTTSPRELSPRTAPTSWA